MANIITSIRIICGIALLLCKPFSPVSCLIYITGGLSDVLDGWVARRLHTESSAGAKLDTAADFVFMTAIIVKTVTAVDYPLWLIVWIMCIAAVKCINALLSLILRGHLMSEHTAMNKISGILLFAIPFCISLFPRTLTVLLTALTCAAAAIAAVHECQNICTGKEIN